MYVMAQARRPGSPWPSHARASLPGNPVNPKLPTIAMSESARDMLRHTVATLAYRGAKAIRGAPEGFGDFRAGPSSRTPLEILSHICDLLDWALTQVQGKQAWTDTTPRSWSEDSHRFFAGLGALDDYLSSDAPLAHPPQQVFQGAIADALTHVGQINYLRRLHGSPVKGENYFRAEITVGHVSADQAAPRREFD